MYRTFAFYKKKPVSIKYSMGISREVSMVTGLLHFNPLPEVMELIRGVHKSGNSKLEVLGGNV